MILKIKNLIGDTISSSEKKNFKKEIQKITLQNLNPKNKTSIKNSIKKTHKLEEFQKEYKSKKDLSDLIKIIETCKKYGTKPFAILARHGFIAVSFLKSMVIKKILSNDDVSKFLMNIKTISSEFIEDINNLKMNDKNFFLNKYGHLRPGTYDILSEKYSDSFDFEKKTIKKIKKEKFILSKKKKEKLNKLLKISQVNLKSDELLKYCEEAIIAREYSKFIFTKSLSHVLDKIILFGKQNKISTEDLSYLEISDLLNQTLKINKLKKIIKDNKKKYNENYFFKFPQLITEENNAYISPYQFNKPNFISSKKISGNTKFIDKNLVDLNLNNKIVLIESADPGYDWIFSHEIKGLITKFGGINSHMAIRCAEFNLPAAIGCGDKLFNQIKNQKNILLDCSEKKVLLSNINI